LDDAGTIATAQEAALAAAADWLLREPARQGIDVPDVPKALLQGLLRTIAAEIRTRLIPPPFPRRIFEDILEEAAAVYRRAASCTQTMQHLQALQQQRCRAYPHLLDPVMNGPKEILSDFGDPRSLIEKLQVDAWEMERMSRILAASPKGTLAAALGWADPDLLCAVAVVMLRLLIRGERPSAKSTPCQNACYQLWLAAGGGPPPRKGDPIERWKNPLAIARVPAQTEKSKKSVNYNQLLEALRTVRRIIGDAGFVLQMEVDDPEPARIIWRGREYTYPR
jgi:hypothetical protein